MSDAIKTKMGVPITWMVCKITFFNFLIEFFKRNKDDEELFEI